MAAMRNHGNIFLLNSSSKNDSFNFRTRRGFSVFIASNFNKLKVVLIRKTF